MTGPIGGVYSLAPAPVSTKNRFLPLDDQGRERRIGSTLADYVREPQPRRGTSKPATARAAISPYVSAITAYTPASQASALVRSMAFSSISLTLTSPATADGSISPVPSDGSITPVPSDGSVGLHGGVGRRHQ